MKLISQTSLAQTAEALCLQTLVIGVGELEDHHSQVEQERCLLTDGTTKGTTV